MRAITKLDTSQKWNKAFTNLLRVNDRAVWGNWTLNPAIVAGAVGIIDPETGEFTHIDNLPGAQLATLNAAQNWYVESSGVRRTESAVEFKGGYEDPSSGLNVDVGTTVKWGFSEESSLSSNGRVTGRTVVNGFAGAMRDLYKWLYDQAEKSGYATPDGISQGFGVVTQTWDCCGAINLGSLENDSTFDLTASVDGAAAMTGAGTVKAGLKGSYKEVKASKSFERHMFPAEKDTAPLNDIAISYNFASFAGKALMPRWAGPLTGLSLFFDNKVGCTYHSTCMVDYKRPDGKGGYTTHHAQESMTGGLKRTISGLPLDAYDLDVTIALKAGETFRFKFATPLAEWYEGQAMFEITGTWPGGASVKWSS